jgi:predicted PurR-regulated permease PerM
MTQIRWYEALGSLVYLGTFTLVVAVLARGEAVLVPLALAVFFAFVLTQPVKMLERWAVPRILAVIVVLTVTLGVVGGFGYLLNRQLGDLAAQMPGYSRAIRVKLAAVRATHGSLASIQEAIDKVSEDLDRQEAAKAQASARPKRSRAQPVRVVPAEPTDVERLVQTMGPIFEPLATAIIVFVLTGFMLAQREDLRNRLIRLVGQGRITVTTRTMDEAGHRISQFLLTQTLINLVFGGVITAGLFLIGVPYAALWGFCAALLRFVPFIGVILATVFPTAVAFVLFEGWAPTLGTLALFISVDVITAHVVEPLVIGHRTGVSSLALLVMALLWTWLWGPIGLVLSTPITVCLATLGRHVPSLEFLSVALGDAPALPAHATYYQRLIAGDDDEAGEIVDQQLATRSRLEVFDTVLIPALSWATRDRAREDIADDEQQFVIDVTRLIVSEIGDAKPEDREAAEAEADAAAPRGTVVGISARGAADALALEMLGRLLGPAEGHFQTASPMGLVAELIAKIRDDPPQAVVIGSLPPGGLHRARYLCKRLRAAVPDVPLVVLRPRGGCDEDDDGGARLRDAGANFVAGSLAEALAELRPLLQTAPAEAGPVKVAASI